MLKFITIALPYINGNIHIGHIYENYLSNFYYIIINKYFKCKIFNAVDCHGLIKKQNILKIDFFNKKKYFFFKYKIKIKKTNSLINKRFTNWVYINFCDNNKIFSKITIRFYNYKKKIFLPDKYLKIICFMCKNEMENFFCFLCKKNNNFYLKSIFKKYIFFKKINSIFLKNYLYNDWDISRIKKYNGFKIISKKKNFFYVWFDAIISYISNNIIYIKKKIFLEKIIQIIGKDIYYFHVIYNIILKFLKFKKTILIQHGFIKNKNKISKSEKNNIKNIKNIFLKLFFILNTKNNLKDIEFNIIEIKNNFKKILFNKIINLFFRIRKFFSNFDNKIIDFYLLNNNKIDFFFLKKNNLQLYIKKIIENFLFINKNININEFWKKNNNFLIHYFYSKNIDFYINNLNIIFTLLNNSKNKKILKNFILFDFKKFNEI